MPALAIYLACCVVPAAVFWLCDRLLRRPPQLWRSHTEAPAPQGPSLQRLVADLHRLEADYRRIERSDLPAKARRLQAVSLAYDDTLRCCCLALDLPAPEPAPLRAIDRLEVEADLAQHGLTW